MTDLETAWLSLPSPDPKYLDRIGVSFRDAQIVGGIRQGNHGLILPCYIDPPSIYRTVEDPALIDFVVFDPAQPSRYRTLCGNGVMLGEAAYEEARFFGVPLPVFRNPMTWLQSGGAGVVPLELLHFGLAVTGHPPVELAGEDIEHGRELRRLVERTSRLELPTVSVVA